MRAAVRDAAVAWGPARVRVPVAAIVRPAKLVKVLVSARRHQQVLATLVLPHATKIALLAVVPLVESHAQRHAKASVSMHVNRRQAVVIVVELVARHASGIVMAPAAPSASGPVIIVVIKVVEVQIVKSRRV